jgi:hypothetical protein
LPSFQVCHDGQQAHRDEDRQPAAVGELVQVGAEERDINQQEKPARGRACHQANDQRAAHHEQER